MREAQGVCWLAYRGRTYEEDANCRSNDYQRCSVRRERVIWVRARELHMVGVSRTPVVRIHSKSHEDGGLRPRHVTQYLEERNVNGDRDGNIHVTHLTPALAALTCVLFGCRARHVHYPPTLLLEARCQRDGFGIRDIIQGNRSWQSRLCRGGRC